MDDPRAGVYRLVDLDGSVTQQSRLLVESSAEVVPLQDWGPRLRLVRIPHERITPAYLMASCAVPFGYPPVRIDGKLYVDGGLLDILPVWAAAEMGATRVIAGDTPRVYTPRGYGVAR